MNERWSWALRYAVVIVLALVLAAALGETDLFKTTKIGKLSAARLAQFFGFGGALLVFWLLARRAASLIDRRGEAWGVLKSLLVPVATLVVVACGQAVMLLVLSPLMTKAWMQAYNWTFIAAILLCAAWVVAALFTGSASLAPWFGRQGRLAKDA